MTFFKNIETFIARILYILPDSFINSYLTDNNFEFLGFLNWVIPFYDFANITELWLIAMVAIFAGRVALKFGSALSDFFRKG